MFQSHNLHKNWIGEKKNFQKISPLLITCSNFQKCNKYAELLPVIYKLYSSASPAISPEIDKVMLPVDD